MTKETAIKLFEHQQIRAQWDEASQTWYFAIVDVIRVLTNTPNPRSYWSVLKTRLKKEGSQLATNCSQLKMRAADGKSYLTDVADTEQLLRLIQSIPSPKAEPFKQWLAQIGYERIREIENPELAQERMKQLYELKGYPKDWIDKRLRGIAIRQTGIDLYHAGRKGYDRNIADRKTGYVRKEQKSGQTWRKRGRNRTQGNRKRTG